MENEKQTNNALTSAKLAEKAIETIRELEASGYNAFEVFSVGKQIIVARADESTSAHVYKEAIED